MDFAKTFEILTGNPPFPWQVKLYERFIQDGPENIPVSCNLPTGLGKTSVIAIWLIALASHPLTMPRRLIYVVNRRTVVDQTTSEVEKYKKQIAKAGLSLDLAISTLRGEFADNREWSSDPSRPAVICGTVDMIGSRLLFSGYGVGFKARPLHAGFLGQDTLLVHDEAHLEPAFQALIEEIEKEQKSQKQFGGFRVMELTATSRDNRPAFGLTEEDEENETAKRRLNAKKSLVFHNVTDEKKQLAERMLELCEQHKDSGQAILVFVRTVETLNAVVAGLRKAKREVQQLTGTQRAFERNKLVDPRREDACPIFARFLPKPKVNAEESERWKIEPKSGTVFLVCTSAGEVGVNLSADHLVCDLTPFESMAQRFGRVNRFGICEYSRIDIVSPLKFSDDEYDLRRARTSALLQSPVLGKDCSPASLNKLDLNARSEAFSPKPTLPHLSDILFDAWALTTIKGPLPGRPAITDYLHGVADWEPPQTKVVWREEVSCLMRAFALERDRKRINQEATASIEKYPIKNHEVLTDRSDRVFAALKKLAAPPDTAVWILDDYDAVEVTTLGEFLDNDKEYLESKTVLLPPQAGGLENGMLDGTSEFDSNRGVKYYDVADEWFNQAGLQLRKRIWDDDDVPVGMSIVDTIDTNPNADDSDNSDDPRKWHRCAIDVEENKNSKRPVALTSHVKDVVDQVTKILSRLRIDEALEKAVVLAAQFHDLGKSRATFQRVLGNFQCVEPFLAKSGIKNRRNQLKEEFRHEFGSLIDVLRMEPSQPFYNQYQAMSLEMQDVVLHLIAVHHGYGRPHFPATNAFDPESKGIDVEKVAAEVPRRFARLQRKYGRWGLAFLESLLRAADWAASANPTEFLD